MPLSLNTNNKRPSFTNFPIPFDHPYTIPVLSLAVGASALFYYSLQAQHKAELREAVRLEIINKRLKHLPTKKNEKETYASLKIDGQFANPFLEWQPPAPSSALVDKLFTNWNYFKRLLGIATTKDKNRVKLTRQNLQIDRLLCQNPSFTWLGQSSCFFTLDNNNIGILTDPAPSDKPLYQLDDLVKITQVVLVSHHHPKHLDERTVLKLGNRVTWYIPLELGSWFAQRGIDNVIEMDWWQEARHGGVDSEKDLRIICVPAMHESCSLDSQKNESLWCSYVIKTRLRTLFFCGDSGYVPDLFQTIHESYGPFAMATLPIEDGGDRSSSPMLHMKLDDALKAHRLLGSPTLSIGIHWDYSKSTETVNATEEGGSPEAYLYDIADRSDGFITTHIGQTIFLEH